jgi:membrane-bound ClpP family serine protease
MSLPVSLLLIALVLFFLEIVLPGGIIGAIGGLLLLVASVLIYFDHGLMAASLTLIGGLLLGALLFFIEIRMISKSPLGNQFKLMTTIDSAAVAEQPASLVGKTGITLTTLAPGGTVRIEGTDYQAASADGLLPRGTPVRVVRRETFKLIVTHQ